MTITTSRAGQLIDLLAAKCKADSAFSADGTVVNDGPIVTGGGTVWTQAIYFGFDGNWEGSFEGTIIDQTNPYIGVTSAQEDLQIRGCAEAWSGDPTWSTLRNQALAMLAGLETIIRTDPSLGVDGTTITRFQVASVYHFPPNTTVGPYAGNGSVVRIPFIIHVRSTLMS